MRKSRLLLFRLIKFNFLLFILNITPSMGQITPDTSRIKSDVTINGNRTIIDGGREVGSNLFHSFKNFSIPNGGSAFFQNNLNVQNILIRVTGNSVSNIDGTLQSNGNANLFFLNPNGIFFGPNARLSIGGSFIGSTANSIKFADGTNFEVKPSTKQPLLTVSVPIGLEFMNNSGDIRVSGNGNGTRTNSELLDTTSGLRVNSNQTLALVGGDLIFSGATLKTAGGRIELGSVGHNTLVQLNSINKGWELGYSPSSTFRDVHLTSVSTVDASGNGAGDIQVQGRNLILEDGSQIESSTLETRSGGVLRINVSDSIKLLGSSKLGSFFNTNLVSLVYPRATGNGGKIDIKAKKIDVSDGATIANGTYGFGDAGGVRILAEDELKLRRKPTRRGGSSITSLAQRRSFGSAGNVDIETNRLILTSGGIISSGTFGEGKGGEVNVKASEVHVSGVSLTGNSSSRISSRTSSIGDGGNVSIKTQKLSLTNGGAITIGGERVLKSARFTEVGQGDAGNLRVEADNITLNQGRVSSATTRDGIKGTGGEGGNISLTSDDLRLVDSEITTSAGGTGNGGDITISGKTLTASNASKITANAFEGRGGNIKIDVDGLFLFPGNIITATSEKGIDGTVEINTSNRKLEAVNKFKPEFELVKFSSGCRSEADKVSFVNIGKGGIPWSPSDPLPSTLGWVDTEELPKEVNNNTNKKVNLELEVEPDIEIIEAQGWIDNGDGTVTLTDSPDDVFVGGALQKVATCTK